MKKSILILVLLLPLVVIGQKLSPNFTITKSTPFAVIDAKSKEYVAIDNGFTISVKTAGKRVTIQKFDINGIELKHIRIVGTY